MTESNDLSTRMRAMSLTDWTSAYGDPPAEARDQQGPVFVIPADDPVFGSTTSYWAEFHGALCDDGGVLTSRYKFHREVRQGPLCARLIAKVQGASLREAAPLLFSQTRRSDTWGFFVVEPEEPNTANPHQSGSGSIP